MSILIIFMTVKYSKSLQGQCHKGLELGVFLSRPTPNFYATKNFSKDRRCALCRAPSFMKSTPSQNLKISKPKKNKIFEPICTILCYRGTFINDVIQRWRRRALVFFDSKGIRHWAYGAWQTGSEMSKFVWHHFCMIPQLSML